MGQTFDDGSFPDAGLADQNGIVFPAAGKNLDDAANLGVAADDRVKISLPGQFDQIAPVFFERLEFLFGILVGDLMAAADGFESVQNILFFDPVHFQKAFDLIVNLRQRNQQVLGRNELILHLLRHVLRRFEDLQGGGIETHFPHGATDLRQALQLDVNNRFELLQIRPDFLHEGPDQSLILFEQGPEQMERLQLRISVILRQAMRTLYCFLRFDGEFVESKGHDGILVTSGDPRDRGLWNDHGTPSGKRSRLLIPSSRTRRR
jgi:hypothetical protein